MWYALLAPSNRHLHGAIFITLTLPFAFLLFSVNPSVKRITLVDVALAALSAVAGLYYAFNNEFYRTYIEGMYSLPVIELVMGLILIGLSLEACRRCVGLGLTAIATIVILYAGLGQYIYGEFGHLGISLEYFISRQTVGEDGIFGVPLSVAATYAFLFVFFGTLYQYSGGGDLMFNVAAALTGRSIAGVPKSCVVSSALYGSVSGSPVADVVTTGPITIPMMIKTGISPKRAGGIESAASCGGAFLPPVMGSVAFLMMEFTGLSYLEIVVASIIPAAIYYLGVFTLIHFDGMRDPSVGTLEDNRLTMAQALRNDWHHLLPIVALVTLIAQGYTASFVASASIAVVIVSSMLNRKPERRILPRAFAFCCFDTLQKMVVLGAAVLVAGLIIAGIDLSGLTGKFTGLLIRIAGEDLLAIFLASAFVIVLLGMGMPTPAVYIMGAALIAPVLVGQFGVPMLQAHMFLLFFSCMSAITPPMAVACFAAATIAKAPPMQIAFEASRIGIVGFFVPFYIAYNPGVLWIGSPLEIMVDIIGAILMVAGLAIAFSRLTNGLPFSWSVRILSSVSGALIIYPQPVLGIIGAGGVVACLFTSLMITGRTRVVK